MITSIILVILIVMSLIGYLIYSFFWPIFVLFILLFILIVIKIVLNIRKYGAKSLFHVFDSCSHENEDVNLVMHIFESQKGFYKIFRVDLDILICIFETNVYLVKVLDYNGNIIEAIDHTLLLQQGSKEMSIPNFFLELTELEKRIQEYVPYFDSQKLVVKKASCMLSFSYSNEYKVIQMHNLYNELMKIGKETSNIKISVEELSASISSYLSNNVNS